MFTLHICLTFKYKHKHMEKLTKKEQKEAQNLWDAFLTKNNVPTMKQRYGKNAPFKKPLTHEQKLKAIENILFTEQGLPIPDRSIYNP